MAHHRFVTILRVAVCCVGPMALIACGSGPSESDIERVVKASVAADRGQCRAPCGQQRRRVLPHRSRRQKAGLQRSVEQRVRLRRRDRCDPARGTPHQEPDDASLCEGLGRVGSDALNARQVSFFFVFNC